MSTSSGVDDLLKAVIEQYAIKLNSEATIKQTDFSNYVKGVQK